MQKGRMGDKLQKYQRKWLQHAQRMATEHLQGQTYFVNQKKDETQTDHEADKNINHPLCDPLVE